MIGLLNKNAMIHSILSYIAGASLIIWGIAHLFPTPSVVRGFGNISEDNKRIVYMEWITEGLTLLFIGILVFLLTFFGDPGSTLQKILFTAIIVMLIMMSVLSLFTGFKINFLPFKLCPVIFTGSAILLLLGLILS
jgi:hypothetical protein